MAALAIYGGASVSYFGPTCDKADQGMNRIASQIAVIALLTTIVAHSAETITNAEKVQFKDRKVYAWLNGGRVEVTNKVELPFNILIETNGTFTVDDGRLRALQDGDVLGRDGMLLRPDGSITPVMDHITLNRGQVLRADGDAAEPQAALQLGDGTVIRPDRKVVTPTGMASWLQDGELLRPGGGTYPARDTITMRNGRVMVQKDGSMLTVEPNRNITMNDGTKVFADGTYILFNKARGTVSGEPVQQLVEGQVLTLEGIVVRRP
jgi:hypothetical protein